MKTLSQSSETYKLKTHWFFGSWSNDFALLYGFGVVAILLSWVLETQGYLFLLFAFIVQSIIDAGHAYTTGLIALNPRSPTFIRNLTLAVLIFLFSFLWLSLQVPYFWSFVIYFTFFHHLRQFFGFYRLYQVKSPNVAPPQNSLFYGLLFAPLLALHFREGINVDIYTRNDLFLFPNKNLFLMSCFLIVLFFLAWLIQEMKIYKTQGLQGGRISSVFIPFVFHIYCFVFAETLPQILFPLLVVHGISYFSIVTKQLKKNFLPEWHTGLLITALFIIAIVGGTVEELLGSNLSFNYLDVHFPISASALLALIITPSLWHYVIDGLIWKRPVLLQLHD